MPREVFRMLAALGGIVGWSVVMLLARGGH